MCEPGYNGTNCEIDVNECSSNPCLNGNCSEPSVNMYKCTCTPGWTGVNCQTDIDECLSYPCINGLCNNLLNDYNCTCYAGFTGKNCDVNINECASNPCANGGVCTALIFFNQNFNNLTNRRLLI